MAVNSSRRPKIIPIIKNIFDANGAEHKFPAGPSVFPSPDPILPTLATAPDNELIKLSPLNDNNTASTATVTRYRPMKEKTDVTK